MNTFEFFQATLPAEGTYFLALFKPGIKAPAHKAFHSLGELANAVWQIEKAHPTWSIYHACASYNSDFIEVDGKKKYRVKENWNKAKSFWCDIDCGEDKASEGKGYATKKEAATAIVNFCAKTGFPRPMFIDSGNGIHCYWPLSKAIRADAWVRIASALKALFAAHGLLVDPSRTADFASILRPVGSFHKKGEPKEVVCKQLSVEHDPREFANLVKSLVIGIKVELPRPAISQEALDANADILSHVSPNVSVPVSAIKIATRCAQVAEMRDLRGDVDHEHWRGVLGIIKHCVEGEELAQEWSNGYAGYSEQETHDKFESWNTAPATCEFFKGCNPTGCQGCEYNGKIKTPMVLGRVMQEQEEEAIEATVDGQVMEIQIPDFPKGYRHEHGKMIRQMKDKDDLDYEIIFCPNLFYPLYQIKKEDGTFSLMVRIHLPDHRIDEVEIDTSCLASPQDMSKALGKYRLYGTNIKDANLHMNAYMKDFLEKLKTEAVEMNTLTNYGWDSEFTSFLLGDRLYHADGTVRKVFVGGNAKQYLPTFEIKGTVDGYAKAIDFIYNRKGMEPMQYALMSSFGSILTPMVDSQYKGLIMSMAGGDTAKGKTTVCMAGLYAFGNAQKMFIGGPGGSTMNGRYGMMAAYQNVPMLFDELTHMKAELVGEMAMQVTMGKGKIRQQVKGEQVVMAETKDFALSLYATSNEGLHGKLAQSQDNSQAEAVRIIEINIDQYPATKLDPKVVDIEPVRRTIERHAGSAGDAFIRYCVANVDEIAVMMSGIGSRLQGDIPDTKFRFWRWHAMATLTALKITNELRITNFDFEQLYAFTVLMFHTMGKTVGEENTMTPEDALNSIISRLHDRTIVTSEYRDSRDGRGPEYVNIRGVPAARYINGNINSKDAALSGKLFIGHKEFVAACKDIRAEPSVVLGYAKSIGVLVPYTSKFTIGKGTNIKTGNTTVVCIDQVKLESLNPDAPKLTIHSNLKPISSASVVAAK